MFTRLFCKTCAQIYPYEQKARGGGGCNLPWFLVRTCGWSPQTPPDSYTRLSEKHDPFIYFPYRKLTHSYTFFFKFYPFIYFLGEKDSILIYFWCENNTHSYNWRPENYSPSSRISVYTCTFIMEVNPRASKWYSRPLKVIGGEKGIQWLFLSICLIFNNEQYQKILCFYCMVFENNRIPMLHTVDLILRIL